MTSSRDRIILRITALFLFAVSTYLLFALPSTVYRSDPTAFFLAGIAAFAFLPSLLFVWTAFGAAPASLLTILAVILVTIFELRTRIRGLSLISVFFAIAAGVAYRTEKERLRREQARVLATEKITEQINILSNDNTEKRNTIVSLERKLTRYSTLKEVVESLSTVLSADDLHKMIIEKTVKTIGKPGRILLFLVDVDRQELSLSASKNATRVKMKKGDFFDQWVLRHRRSLLIEDVAMDFRFPSDDVEDAKKIFRSLIATPLVREDKVIGILRIDSPRELMYGQDDLRLLDIIADLDAVALQNTMLYARTEELAIRDGLTGLFVRRYFMERFVEELKRVGRKKGALALAILDIDHFKEYNDKYGHVAGDLVLKHLAGIVRSKLRDGDIAARYGGEEIVILLSGRGRKEAFAEAEELCRLIKAKPLMLRRQEAKITVSIGVASYPDDAMTPEDILSKADERLYKAKMDGRDRVYAG